jgi:integrase
VAAFIGTRAAAGRSRSRRPTTRAARSSSHRWQSLPSDGIGSSRTPNDSTLGDLWEDNDLVFPNQVGRPLSSQNLLQRHFHPLLERLSLPKIRFHDLRHTAATLLLSEGVHPKIVSEMLGHTEIGITLNLYSHVTPAMHEAASGALGRLLDQRGPEHDQAGPGSGRSLP